MAQRWLRAFHHGGNTGVLTPEAPSEALPPSVTSKDQGNPTEVEEPLYSL